MRPSGRMENKKQSKGASRGSRRRSINTSNSNTSARHAFSPCSYSSSGTEIRKVAISVSSNSTTELPCAQSPNVGSRTSDSHQLTLGSDLRSEPNNLNIAATLAEPNIAEHFKGVLTKKEAANLTRRDDFTMYYRVVKDQAKVELETTIPLFICYRNSENKVFSFRVEQVLTENNSMWWTVMINKQHTQMFRRLLDLVRCYHSYRFINPETRSQEMFPIWKYTNQASMNP
ncbi:SH2 domain-containing protein [Caenorhabditis elegans]|uniref:SH2 domain-containing protein n=1 Tax=Caenorhabditis elegans TaxID=6239 RepID=O76585_CAEEL|nr:SH2 domain-containing protein [Caenorhabditis elegans]CCD62422.1 SH2 domain-containing protein [Caenorhabditis elegans]|eukprot:NP_494749.2 Uncharacterized protein CELE_C16A11.7 [Caenorhabditis elegans]